MVKSYVETIQENFRFILSFQFVLSVLYISSTLFIIPRSSNVLELMYSLQYNLPIILEVCIICHVGQELENSSEDLHYALKDSQLHNSDCNQIKNNLSDFTTVTEFPIRVSLICSFHANMKTRKIIFYLSLYLLIAAQLMSREFRNVKTKN